jgi:pimeloyl-ACP methyl ester carboxylesterase
MSVAPALLPAVHDTGSGPPVLFLHAFPLDASQWDHQVAALSGRYRCLRPDAYGCGDSPPPPPDGLQLDDLARGIVAAMDERGVGRVAVVGLSMGGYIAFSLLRVAPSRVGALVLCDTRAGADSEPVRSDRLAMASSVRRSGTVEGIVESMAARLLAPRSLDEYHVSDPVRGRIRRCTPAGVAACQEAMAARPDSTSLLAGIAVPSLVVVGSEDTVTPPAEARAMAAAIPGARIEVIDGAGHLSNLERWDAFNAVLAGFLAEAWPA